MSVRKTTAAIGACLLGASLLTAAAQPAAAAPDSVRKACTTAFKAEMTKARAENAADVAEARADVLRAREDLREYPGEEIYVEFLADARENYRDALTMYREWVSFVREGAKKFALPDCLANGGKYEPYYY
jgi:hypothetical protein